MAVLTAGLHMNDEPPHMKAAIKQLINQRFKAQVGLVDFEELYQKELKSFLKSKEGFKGITEDTFIRKEIEKSKGYQKYFLNHEDNKSDNEFYYLLDDWIDFLEFKTEPNHLHTPSDFIHFETPEGFKVSGSYNKSASGVVSTILNQEREKKEFEYATSKQQLLILLCLEQKGVIDLDRIATSKRKQALLLHRLFNRGYENTRTNRTQRPFYTDFEISDLKVVKGFFEEVGNTSIVDMLNAEIEKRSKK